jgi:hypothetical protein
MPLAVSVGGETPARILNPEAINPGADTAKEI